MADHGQKLTRDQNQLLAAELIRLAQQLHPITVRGLYYQAVLSPVLDFITKDKDGGRTNYRMVQGKVLSLRESGQIPWHHVIDPSRTDYSAARWTSPQGFATVAPLYYRLDFWEDQPIRPVVLVEKDGQVPVYQSHAERFGVDVWASKGYGSATYLRDLALSIRERIQQGQDLVVVVCADFDPSGCDWPRAAEAEVRQHLDAEHCDPDAVRFHRELVTPADLSELGPAVALRAPNGNDARFQSFCDDHGFPYQETIDPKTGRPSYACDWEVCVEMDAISPYIARQRLENLYKELHQGSFDDLRNTEWRHQQRITEALASLGEVA